MTATRVYAVTMESLRVAHSWNAFTSLHPQRLPQARRKAQQRKELSSILRATIMFALQMMLKWRYSIHKLLRCLINPTALIKFWRIAIDAAVQRMALDGFALDGLVRKILREEPFSHHWQSAMLGTFLMTVATYVSAQVDNWIRKFETLLPIFLEILDEIKQIKGFHTAWRMFALDQRKSLWRREKYRSQINALLARVGTTAAILVSVLEMVIKVWSLMNKSDCCL